MRHLSRISLAGLLVAGLLIGGCDRAPGPAPEVAAGAATAEVAAEPVVDDPQEEAWLRQRLAYLVDNPDIPEIAWVEFDGPAVYVAFSEEPASFGLLMEGAAREGSVAYQGREFHAWALNAALADRDWQRGDAGFICWADAMDGRIGNNSCARLD